MIKRIMSRIGKALKGKEPFFSRRSKKWPKVRQEFLIKNPFCAVCMNSQYRSLEVHHIRPFHLFPELELMEDNLITLCNQAGRDCHFHWGHFGNWREYNPDIGLLKRFPGKISYVIDPNWT